MTLSANQGGELFVTVDSQLRFSQHNCPTELIDQLEQKLRLPNPAYEKLNKLGRYTGHIPPSLCYLDSNDGEIFIPRGTINLLRQLCKRLNIGVRFINNTVSFDPAPISANVELRAYQRQAVDAMIKGKQGYIVASCGSGKTVMGIDTIARIGQPALIIVHTHDLLNQWVDRIRDILGMDPGTITAGKCQPGKITVATIQTLSKLPADIFDQVANKIGCVVFDECHHLPAASFYEVLSKLPSLHRFGLSATPEREDGLTPLLNFGLGNQLFKIDYAELLRQGYLQKPTVKQIATNFNFTWTGPDSWHDCMGALIEDHDRNQQIVDLVEREVKADQSILVISGRVEHCKTLQQLLGARGIVAEVLIGATKTKERARIMNDLRSGALRVVLSSSLADEGLDCPRLSRVILATPSKAQGKTIQRLGRIMRLAKGKSSAVLYDLIDSLVGPLKWQALHRQKAYAGLFGHQQAA